MTPHPGLPRAAVLSDTLSWYALKDAPLRQTTCPDIWIQKICLCDSHMRMALSEASGLVVATVKAEGLWPSGCTQWGRDCSASPQLPFRGIPGSEWVGRRMTDIHSLEQPTFPARALSPWLVGPPGPSLSPCLSSFYLCSCSALEASPQVRSLPVCQGLVQIPPICPSCTEKAFTCEKTDIHC